MSLPVIDFPRRTGVVHSNSGSFFLVNAGIKVYFPSRYFCLISRTAASLSPEIFPRFLNSPPSLPWGLSPQPPSTYALFPPTTLWPKFILFVTGPYLAPRNICREAYNPNLFSSSQTLDGTTRTSTHITVRVPSRYPLLCMCVLFICSCFISMVHFMISFSEHLQFAVALLKNLSVPLSSAS